MSGSSARCNVDGTTLTALGVANFTSALSPNPLTWTVGYAPDAFTKNGNERRFYLGTPQGFDLNNRTDITGCALFFTGTEAGLNFTRPGASPANSSTSSGTCADALGSTCEADLNKQAQDLVTRSTGPLQCSDIAQTLQSSPPGSCSRSNTWGNITAKAITGPDSASVLQLGDCHPTTNSSYDVRSVVTFPQIGDAFFGSYITPLMTIFAPDNNATGAAASSEVHLSCMKLLEDVPANKMTQQGGGEGLVARKSSLTAAAALGVVLVTGALIA